METRPRLLLVDDDESIVEALSERFASRGFRVSTAMSGKEALVEAKKDPAIIFLDLQLPDGDGLSVLRALRQEGVQSTVIMITAYGTVKAAVEAMAEGAYDFIEKPFEPALVEQCIKRALERSNLSRENEVFRQQQPSLQLVASDEIMQPVIKVAKKAAASQSTVLLLGESGTGKEVFARQIAAWSTRAKAPFVAINCAALTETLLESELFGHEKGSFTGAAQRKPGKLELAEGGTLFLDEIGDTSPTFQTKLLRVLENRQYERVGGTQTLDVDVRIIAATNRDLQQLMAQKLFRQDLYFRLNVISLSLPPLRERPSDVEPLCEYFLRELCREAKRPLLTLSAKARAALRAYSWPGNIRELRNAMERAVVLCEEQEVSLGDLPAEFWGARTSEVPTGNDFHSQVDSFRKKLLEETLAKFGGNQTKAAEHLGLQRTYLARLLKQYEIG
jgi:DNA-binding NtrC family response regulator